MKLILKKNQKRAPFSIKGWSFCVSLAKTFTKVTMRVMLGKSAKTYTTGEGEKLDGVATLVTDLARGYSTTKQNPHMCNQPLYGAII